MRKKFFQRFSKMKEILLFVNNKKNKKIIKTKRNKICVVGVSKKIGVTHLCLCLANFLSSALGKRVIYVELRRNSQLLSVVGLKQVLIGKMIGYEYKGVRYVLSDDTEAIRQLMMTEKAWFVVDMESLNNDTHTIFTNCNNRIIIGSLSPWCKKELYDFFINNNIEEYDIDNMRLALKNKTKKEKDDFLSYYNIKEFDVPFIEDPFSLKEEHFNHLFKLLA